MPWPPSADEVMRELRIASIDPDQATVLQESLDAAVDVVMTERADLWAADPDADPAAAVHRGTVRYAGRLYTRAVNTSGVDPVTGLGVPPTYAIDDDIARLLGLWRYRRPSAG